MSRHHHLESGLTSGAGVGDAVGAEIPVLSDEIEELVPGLCRVLCPGGWRRAYGAIMGSRRKLFKTALYDGGVR